MTTVNDGTNTSEPRVSRAAHGIAVDIVPATDISRSGQSVLAERLARALASVGFTPCVSGSWTLGRPVVLVGLSADAPLANCALARATLPGSAPAIVVWERVGREVCEVSVDLDVPVTSRPLHLVTLNRWFARPLQSLLPRARVHAIAPPIPTIAVERRGPRRGDHAVFIGRLTTRKGARWLAEAWIDQVFERTGLPLLLCGSGYDDGESEEPAVVELARRHPDRLSMRRFWGFRERQAVLANAAAAVFPYRSDHLPQALLEAMAAGVPVVASDIPELATVLDEGRLGSVFERASVASLADAVTAVLADPVRSSSMAERARQFVEQECSERRVGAAYARALFGPPTRVTPKP